jgi:hypothetical protein
MDLLFSVEEKKAELFTLVSILRISWLWNLYTSLRAPYLSTLIFFWFLEKTILLEKPNHRNYTIWVYVPRFNGTPWQYGAEFSGFSSTHALFHIAPGWLRLFIIADEANTFFAVLSQEFSFESWKGNRAVGKAYLQFFLVGGTIRVTEVHQNSRCIRLKGRPLNSLSLLSATALPVCGALTMVAPPLTLTSAYL